MSATPAVKADVVKLPTLADRPLRIAPRKNGLRIAQVAPLSESVPPKLYGGTERVVATLCDELVRQGHDVTLFASGDSNTDAKLVAACPSALRLSQSPDPLAVHLHMIEKMAQRADEFDIIHFHVAPLHFSIARRLRTPHVTTLHGRLDLAPIEPLYSEFSEQPMVSVSDAQRAPLPHQNWVATVYHGLPARELSFRPEAGTYLAFLGRIAREKRPDRAIAIAKACGCHLKIAAKVDPADVDYFTREIEPLLDDPLVEFIGEINESQKGEFLGHARALLFPIDWPEPFGLVMIESLACGTPVVAFRGGSVGEVIEHGVTGFVVDDLDQAVTATKQVDALDRRACRQAFDERFSATRMADDYLKVYTRLMGVAANVGH
ncbi:MAG TPA: glycosyltransferase family 4 protein [Vicinamibacterales bacterium]|jgi:glycosyltransferase involved in cell wall biosynthesis